MMHRIITVICLSFPLNIRLNNEIHRLIMRALRLVELRNFIFIRFDQFLDDLH